MEVLGTEEDERVVGLLQLGDHWKEGELSLQDLGQVAVRRED